MSDITIPPAAHEAALTAYAQCKGGVSESVTAACLAMLTAWPGLSRVHRDWDGTALVCLPLPQENTNAEG